LFAESILNQMKVLITAPSLDETENVSGISSVVKQIIEHADAEFFHFTVGRKDGENAGIGWILKQFFLVPQFLREIRNKKFDLVHINATLTPLSILRDAALVKTARFANVPVLLHIHGGKYLVEDFDSNLLSKLTEKMFHWSKIVVVLSKLEKDFVEKRWKNLDVKILENAVSLENVKTRKEETVEKTIIFLGRLHESKGLHEIIETCRILKNEGFEFRFRAFGAGDLKDFFVAEMSKILGEKFFYGGIISGAKKWQALATSDIFLLPSRYGEGLPVAMLEAMAAGNVVVVSEMASIGEVIKDGVNGFSVEPRNVSQIVEKLKLLLSDKTDWVLLRKNAKITIEEKFDLKDYIKKLEKIYTEIEK
jgi:glycosyltransferase involved in cell wall biosynthesis